ncbi:Clathrin interactor 1 [Strongyloides ratti]|uniref:Clathrin interactor 1 n=1 Tax=Strongyloides ratti TaxID=34506 RepID=A0A090LUT6_STRRB|nr:Clathrin interactor 1 [Strongyloides ratti]CEF71399.1 Clathrin interactor 1 [Strongyloides ratti]
MSNLFSGLASITKTVSDALNNPEVKKFQDQVTGYVMNFTDAEIKVRNATNDEGWGPTNQQCDEIASMTFSYDLCTEASEMLFKRMMENSKGTWRRTYKSLRLVDHLLKHGSERFIKYTREHSAQIRGLQNFHYIDEKGKDQGINIRVKAKAIIQLLQDENLLIEERKKAKTMNRDKYVGYSKEDMIHMSGSSSMSGFGNDYYNKYSDTSSNVNKSQSMNDDIHKEANLFNFPDDRDMDHTELGIPNTPNNDDDFGEFESPVKITESQKKVEVDLFGDIVPIAPPPNNLVSPTFSSKSMTSPVLNTKTTTNDLINLMDDLNVIEPPSTQQTSINVFAATRMDSDILPIPQKIEPLKNNVGNLLDIDINTTDQNTNIQDEFADFVAFGGTTTTNEPQQLDFFNSMSTISPKESQNKIDTPINEKNNLDLGNFISEKKLPPKESTKVGSTWNGLEDKFGLDFANFNLKKGESEKKKVSMNEMKSKGSIPTNLF